MSGLSAGTLHVVLAGEGEKALVMTDAAHRILRQQNVEAYAPSGGWPTAAVQAWTRHPPPLCKQCCRGCSSAGPALSLHARIFCRVGVVAGVCWWVGGEGGQLGCRPTRAGFPLPAPADCEDGRRQAVDPKTVAACAAAQVRACGTALLAAGFAAVSVMSKRGQLAPLRTVFYFEEGESRAAGARRDLHAAQDNPARQLLGIALAYGIAIAQPKAGSRHPALQHPGRWAPGCRGPLPCRQPAL